MRILTFLFLLTLPTTFSWAQHTIKGVVFDPNDNSPLPGVTVYEDSTNQIRTDKSGQFSIEVKELPTTLTFAFIGMLTRTMDIQSDSSVTVFLKPYTLTHYFDSQKLGLSITSGVMNTPIGGKLYFTTPYILDQLLIKSYINYQTNLDDNDFLNGAVSLDNIITGQYFGLGISGYYQEVSLDKYHFENKSVEIDFFVSRIPFDFSVGYNKLYVVDNENVLTSYDGLTVGLSKYFHEPIKLSASSRILIYDRLIGFQAQINKSFNKVETFTRYQQLGSFSEFTLGIGYMITYIFNDPNKY